MMEFLAELYWHFVFYLPLLLFSLLTGRVSWDQFCKNPHAQILVAIIAMAVIAFIALSISFERERKRVEVRAMEAAKRNAAVWARVAADKQRAEAEKTASANRSGDKHA